MPATVRTMSAHSALIRIRVERVTVGGWNRYELPAGPTELQAQESQTV